jgi:hypothetical protein
MEGNLLSPMPIPLFENKMLEINSWLVCYLLSTVVISYLMPWLSPIYRCYLISHAVVISYLPLLSHISCLYLLSTVISYTNPVVISYTNPVVISYNNTVVISYTKQNVISYTKPNFISYTKPNVISYNNTVVISYTKQNVISYANTDVISYANTDVISYANTVVVSYANSNFNERFATIYFKFRNASFRWCTRGEYFMSTALFRFFLKFKILIYNLWMWGTVCREFSVWGVLHVGSSPDTLYSVWLLRRQVPCRVLNFLVIEININMSCQ